MTLTQSEIPQNAPWIEINLDNLIHNLTQIRTLLPPSIGIMAVVKDNAYGCGSVMISRILEAHSVRFFAVSRICEARTLREAGVKSPILVLGPARKEDLHWGTAAGIRFSLNDLSDMAVWKTLKIPIRFHVKIDTGMSRLGLLPEETRAFITELQAPVNLSCEGVYTHFAKADDLDSGSIDLQMTSFRKVIGDFNANGVQLSEIHYANSAAIMRHRVEHCTMVRPGIALYGCKPNPAQDFSLDLKPVLCMKGRVLKMKRVAAGVAVSYGGTYVTASDTTIATIGLGYGQGLPRQLGNKGAVLIRGRRYGIVGRVTMDYIMVDAGADPHFSVGDEVVAMGNQGNESIHPDEIALLCNTIAYEILCSINSSIDRQYILNGKVIHREQCKPF